LFSSPLNKYTKKIIKEKSGIDETTIEYLAEYKYGNELLLKLAKAMK